MPHSSFPAIPRGRCCDADRHRRLHVRLYEEVNLMNKNSKVIASILGGLLLVVLILPISMGGTGGTLFWVVFWVLAIAIAATLIFAFANRRQPR